MVEALHEMGEKLHFLLLTNISTDFVLKTFEKIKYIPLLGHSNESNMLAEEQC